MYQVQYHIIVCNGLFLIISLTPPLFVIEVYVHMYQVQCHVIACNGSFLITSLTPPLFVIEVSVCMCQVQCHVIVCNGLFLITSLTPPSFYWSVCLHVPSPMPRYCMQCVVSHYWFNPATFLLKCLYTCTKSNTTLLYAMGCFSLLA